MKKLFGLLLLIILISCSSKPSESAIQTAIAKTEKYEAEIATSTPSTINSPTPKLTSTITNTPTITLSPTITLTPTITVTSSITPTFTNTPTMTKAPGVGDDFYCGENYVVNVLEPPRFEPYFYGEKPSGIFLLLKVSITNKSAKQLELNDDDFKIFAAIDGMEVLFEEHWDATFDWVYHHWGLLIYPHDEIGPTLTSKVGIAFDINPDEENLHFVWFCRESWLDDLEDSDKVVIPLE